MKSGGEMWGRTEKQEGRWGYPGEGEGWGRVLLQGRARRATGCTRVRMLWFIQPRSGGVMDKVRLALTTMLSLIYSCAGRQHCPRGGGLWKCVCVHICINADQGVCCLAFCLKSFCVRNSCTSEYNLYLELVHAVACLEDGLHHCTEYTATNSYALEVSSHHPWQRAFKQPLPVTSLYKRA